MKKILILNGSPRKNGKTASLVKAFVEGAKSAGHVAGTLLSCHQQAYNGHHYGHENKKHHP